MGFARFGGLLDLGFGPQIGLQLLNCTALKFLLNLGLDLLKGRWLDLAHIIKPDHMKAKLGLDGGVGDFAFFQLGHCLGKLLDESLRLVPIQITAIGC